MMIGDIFHVAIRAADLGTTVGFYCNALGFKQLARPAGLNFPGAWLALPHASEKAVLHVYAQTAATDRFGQVATDNERGTVDHVAFRAGGFVDYRSHLSGLGLTFREQHLNESSIWQIFVHDPNGVKIELSFSQSEECDFPVSIPESRRYSANERFFNPGEYTRFNQCGTSV